MVRCTDTMNDLRLDGALSPTGRVSTHGDLKAASTVARNSERTLAEEAGAPYQGVVGHAADTTWTGQPVPREWHDQTQRVNSSLGAAAGNYPVGYRPTIFRALLPDGTLHPTPRKG